MQSILRHTSRRRQFIQPLARKAAVPTRIQRAPNLVRTLIGMPIYRLRYTTIEASCSVKRYTADHEAIAFDDTTGIGTISITNHAQSSLGDVVFVELPNIGTKVEQGGEYVISTQLPRFEVEDMA
jgi:Glycine cleavage H-protein